MSLGEFLWFCNNFEIGNDFTLTKDRLTKHFKKAAAGNCDIDFENFLVFFYFFFFKKYLILII